MPIRVFKVAGRTCPRFVCDVCDEIIAQADMASYEWDDDNLVEGGSAEVYFLHKSCDKTMARQMGKSLTFEELALIIPYLRDNTAVDMAFADFVAEQDQLY